jgi:hypothetical protein
MDTDSTSTLAFSAGGLVGLCAVVIVVVLVARSMRAGKAQDFVRTLAQIMQLRKIVGDRDAACAALGFSGFMLPPGSSPDVYVGRVEGCEVRIGSVRWAPKGQSERTTVLAFVKPPRDLATKFEAATETWALLSPLAMAGFAQVSPYLGTTSIRAGDPEAAKRILAKDPQLQKRVETILADHSQLGRIAHDGVRASLDPSKEPVAVIDDIGHLIFAAKKLAE